MDKNFDDTFTIDTSRTTYYNSLVTNRAMDYPWGKGQTVREMLECGPTFSTLKESKLSNHLGFNGFVISSDNFVPLVKRADNLSIGKNTYGVSVGGSLKAKYGLNENKDFNEAGLKQVILSEIKDELNLPEEALGDFALEDNLLYAYRDVVEGGKPQLVFYMKSPWDKTRIQDAFNRYLLRHDDLIKEGVELLWLPKEELKKITIGLNKITYLEEDYPMTYSAAASLAMFIQSL